MELKESNSIKPRGKRGGARANAGRPKGSVDKVTIAALLTAVETASGRPYTDLLTQDFLDARSTDRGLAAKYHNLILNKVMATMASVEVTNSADDVDAKTAAFTAALAKITEIAATTK
jgi:hypothetical protein